MKKEKQAIHFILNWKMYSDLKLLSFERGMSLKDLLSEIIATYLKKVKK